MRRSRWSVLAVLAATFLAACGGGGDSGEATGTATGTATAPAEEEPTTVPSATVSVKTYEYRYEMPATFAGGLVRLELDNSAGKESHEASLYRLEAGRKASDLFAALTPTGPTPAFAKVAGGPGPVLPGAKAVYAANLEPGTYAFTCFVPAPDGKAHLEKGMVAEATVSGGTQGELPAADVTIGGREFEFTGTEGLRSGAQTVKVVNEGKQEHFWGMAALAPGKNAQDVVTFFSGPPSGPPPITGFPGLVSSLPPGGQGTRTLDLAPGSYVMFCLVPDTDGTPHAAKGMLEQITVS